MNSAPTDMTMGTKTVMVNESPRARVVRMMRKWVAEGVWAPGEVLPPEREISSKLGVCLATVQRAFRVMESEGVVVKHRGRTRTISDRADADPGLLRDSVLVMTEIRDAGSFPRGRGWAAAVVGGVLQGLGENHAHAMVLTPKLMDARTLSRMTAGHPMGLIVPQIAQPHVDIVSIGLQAKEAGLPVVLFGDEEGMEVFDRVVPDHEAGGYELTKLLLGQGRRRIRQIWAMVNLPQWANARRHGYERAMREAGLEPLPPIVIPEPTYDEIRGEDAWRAGAQAMAGGLVPSVLGPDPVDALLCTTDGHVPMLMHALRILRKTPNVDVAVVGYDDYWDETETLVLDRQPPVATVDKGNFAAGEALTQLLIDRRAGKLPPEPQIRRIPPLIRLFDDKGRIE